MTEGLDTCKKCGWDISLSTGAHLHGDRDCRSVDWMRREVESEKNMAKIELPSIDLKELERVFSILDIKGVRYGLGAKIPLSRKPTDSKITRVDCSGWFRYGLYWATEGKLKVPDGSQMQRAWCEQMAAKGVLKKKNYKDLPMADESRLFVAFIKPFTNGCGSVGHVWFVSKINADMVPDTMESHGGVGINSRPWNYRTLWNQVYSCYELPTYGRDLK